MQPSAAVGEDFNIAGRIDRLPWSRWHLKVGVPIATAWFFDAFDSLAIAFVLPVLIDVWRMGPIEIGLLIGSSYVGQSIGSLYFGLLSERIGRVRPLFISLGLFATMSLLASLAWSPAALMVMRFAQGIGLGGEVPVMATYIAEWSNARQRGRVSVVYQGFFLLGILLCALTSRWIVPRLGWRWVFLLGALPALIALPLRRMLPESPRWLASQGRFELADALVGQVESEIARTTPLPPAPKIQSRAQPRRRGALDVMRGTYRKRTIALAGIWLSASTTIIGLTTWTPSLLRIHYHVSVEEALNVGIHLSIAALISFVITASLVDRISRRALFVSSLMCAAAFLLPLTVSPDVDVVWVRRLIYGSYCSITTMSLSLNMYTAELYPVELRSFGVGIGNMWLKIASVTTPLVIGALLQQGGVQNIFIFLELSVGVGALFVIMFAVDTRDRSLEELSTSIR